MNQANKVAAKTATAGNVRPENQVTAQRFIRISYLTGMPAKQGKLPVICATLWRCICNSRFPQPIKFSSAITVWDGDQLDAFDAQCVANGYTKKPLIRKAKVLIGGAK